MKRATRLATLILMACAAPLLLFECSAKSDAPRRVVSLDGSGWKLVGLQPGEGEKLGVNLKPSESTGLIPTTVPNDVQLAVGLKDPYGQGADIVDINKREWWYSRSFPRPKITPGSRVRLVFDGVDYFADVWLNGQKLGSHEGAYTRFSYEIAKLLRPKGDNYLAVRVTSPWKVPGRSHYEFMKGEFDETWDALPGPGQVVFPLGLHRSVRLEVTGETRLEEIRVCTTELRDRQADLKLHINASHAGLPREATLQVIVKPENFSGPTLNLPTRTLKFSSPAGEPQEVELQLQVDDPQLWWTWDQGPQNLYTATASLLDAKGAVLDTLSTNFGIRTLSRDANMLYRLNGRVVFFTGAWYSMATLYPAATNRWIYEKDLRLLRHAHANHLVNYTVIEKEDFYELADQLGILLFIELPFNQLGPLDALNAQYPRRDEYIRWSAQEVTQMVRRLANHPSVGVWSAISETTSTNREGDYGADFATSGDPQVVKAADGYRIFVNEIEKVVKMSDPDALYFPSYCDFGERHFWEGGLFPNTTYDQQFDREAGFVSEYGALAFRPMESIRRTVDPAEVWPGTGKGWSNLRLPVNLRKLSYVSGMQYSGLGEYTTDYIIDYVERLPKSFRDFALDSQVYQAFLFGYAGDAYRRKLFAPINGIRTWHFKDFPEKPVSGFGVIDCFDVPKMAYYAAKRTWAPVTMSYAVRYALESLPAGSVWKVPVWISNATDRSLSLNVESALFNLKGERVRQVSNDVSVEPRKATPVLELGWRLPEEPGVYLLRGQARSEKGTEAATEMYVKVVPTATHKSQRVLIVGTPEWALPTADYLANLGVEITTATSERQEQFPGSVEALRQKFDVIWLTGYSAFWREAPQSWATTMAQAVEQGVILIHTGSWASFHGGGGGAAALDLTPVGPALPVAVEAENDVFEQPHFTPAGTPTQPAAADPAAVIRATAAAPAWLREATFGDDSPANYHLLGVRPGATTLLEVDGQPLLVTGRYGQGLTIAYLGFSPQPSGRGKDSQSIAIDHQVRSSSTDRVFTMISATMLALAAGGEPSAPLNELINSRATPLFETLKNTPASTWPEVSVSWTTSEASRQTAHLRIQNGAQYLRGFRLRFKNADIGDDNLLPLWSDQFFDLLPGEVREATVEIFTADKRPLSTVSLEAEAINRNDTRDYPVPPPK